MSLAKDDKYQDEHSHLVKTFDFIGRTLKLLWKRVQRPAHTEAFLAELSRKQIDQFEAARHKPYYGRLDLVSDGHTETYYIGDVGLQDPQTMDLWVTSWQSPIANVWYEFSGAEPRVTYLDPDDNPITVEVLRKRYLDIKDGRLLRVDEVTAFDDEENARGREQSFLDAALDKHTDGTLQTITATIQREQNLVIRFSKDTPVIVQGVAGSGKSSIGVYRASYLLFNNKKSIKASDVLIIGPNETFLKNLAPTLPTLQAERINQHTFLSWAQEIMGMSLTVTPLHELLRLIREGKLNSQEYSTVAKIKGSVDFAAALERFVRDLEIDTLASLDIELRTELFISPQQLLDMYFNDNAPYTSNIKRQRVLRSVKNWVEGTIKDMLVQVHREDDRMKWVSVVNRPEVRSSLVEQQSKNTHRRETEIRSLNKRYNEFESKWSEFDLLDVYMRFTTDTRVLREYLPVLSEAEVNLIVSEAQKSARSKSWSSEDVAALLHLYSILSKPLPNYGHIIIDEAQDMTPLELDLLIRTSRNNSVTILGDMQQSLYSFRSITSWREVSHIFDALEGARPEFIQLQQSYRSTREITIAANILLESENEAVPVGRHGPRPVAIEVESGNELLAHVTQQLQAVIERGHKSIGVVGNTVSQCNTVFDELRRREFDDVQLLLELNEAVRAQITVLPEFVAKGLEFDAVIVLNAGENRFDGSKLGDALLYVLMTRARHELILYYYQAPATSLGDVMDGGELFDVVQSEHKPDLQFDF